MAKHNKKKVGRQTRKNRKRQKEILDSDLSKSKQPHSMVVSRGKVGKSVQKLIENFKSIMEPYTATQVKSQKNNSLKDFISIAPSLRLLINITHVSFLFKKHKLFQNLSLSLILFYSPKPTPTLTAVLYACREGLLSGSKYPISH